MPKTVKPLSDVQIKTAKPKNKPYKMSDGGGLYLHIPATDKNTANSDTLTPRRVKG